MNHVTLEVDAGVATLTLRRPDRANAFDLATARELLDAVHTICADDDVHALLVRAEGQHFCGGGDVRAMVAEPPSWAGQVAGLVHDAILLLHMTKQVVVVGARGAVAGAGLSLSLVADLVVVAPSTRFLAAWGTIGLTPDGGATWLLPRVVGNRRAAAMVLGGREVGGSEAVDWGLATEVVEEADVDRRATEFAVAAIAVDGRVAGASRQLLQSSWDTDLPTRLDDELSAVNAARLGNQAALDRFLSRDH